MRLPFCVRRHPLTYMVVTTTTRKKVMKTQIFLLAAAIVMLGVLHNYQNRMKKR